MNTVVLALVLLATPKDSGPAAKYLRWPGAQWQSYTNNAEPAETLLRGSDIEGFNATTCEVRLSKSGATKLRIRGDLSLRIFSFRDGKRNLLSGVFLDEPSARPCQQPVAHVAKHTLQLRRTPGADAKDCDFARALSDAFAQPKAELPR